MGRTTTPIKVENYDDLAMDRNGSLTADKIRFMDIPNALVDRGAALLSLCTSDIKTLGLRKVNTKQVLSSVGPKESNLYSAVRLTIKDRSCTIDVLEVPNGVPTLVGNIPLEHLNFVVDPKSQSLIGNPSHGGEHVYDMM